MPPQNTTSDHSTGDYQQQHQDCMRPTRKMNQKTQQVHHKRTKWSSNSHDFHIGLIVASTTEIAGDHILALANPASACTVVALTVLEESNGFADWCQRHQIKSETTVYQGAVGMDAILNNPLIDGVYVTGVMDNKTDIIEQALYAGKHVLADDPITTSVTDYCRLINLAHDSQLHLQDTTMFVYHHAVREFIDCILDTETFGDITKIDVCFDINPTDARFHGILDRNDNRRGVVGDLCRYCAVLGLLIFQRSGRKAISVQINGIERDQDDLPIHVVCDVIFEGGASLTVDSSYVSCSSRTKQTVEVRSDSHSASMGDFVFSHHSLACYRVYQKATVNGKEVVELGDSIDVEGGQLQEVQVWRKFSELSTDAYHEEEFADTGQELFRRYDFVFAAVQSQNIVSALTESLNNEGRVVALEELTINIPV